MKFAWTGLLVVFAALGAMADGAAWEFSRQTVIQRWPWSRKVDVMFCARVVDGAGTRCRAAHVALKVKGVAVPESELDTAWILGEGYQTIVWNPAETGYPAELTSADLAVEVLEDVKDVGYLTIDLETGTRAYKPLSFSNEVNAANSPYKTTHMAFRYIPSTISGDWRAQMDKTSFKMGSDGTRTDIGIIQTDKDREGRADVTLTKDFFFGVFPVTGQQYKLLGGTTTFGDDQAVQKLNYDTIRGPDGTNKVDGVDGRYCFPKSKEVKADSPIGRLRKLTGLMFDLPTEAQWEYAARAGSEGEYFFPDTVTGQQNVLNELANYGYNQNPTPVGRKRPNAWGIYDLIGCCHQWTTTCGKLKSTDAYIKNQEATDPIGLTPNAGTGVMRFLRGSHNGTGGGSTQCRVQRFAYRMVQPSNVVTDGGEGKLAGFRLALTLE